MDIKYNFLVSNVVPWMLYYISEKRLCMYEQILKRDTALATAAIYDSMFSAEDGTVPATFQVIKIEDLFIAKPVV